MKIILSILLFFFITSCNPHVEKGEEKSQKYHLTLNVKTQDLDLIQENVEKYTLDQNDFFKGCDSTFNLDILINDQILLFSSKPIKFENIDTELKQFPNDSAFVINMFLENNNPDLFYKIIHEIKSNLPEVHFWIYEFNNDVITSIVTHPKYNQLIDNTHIIYTGDYNDFWEIKKIKESIKRRQANQQNDLINTELTLEPNYQLE